MPRVLRPAVRIAGAAARAVAWPLAGLGVLLVAFPAASFVDHADDTMSSQWWLLPRSKGLAGPVAVRVDAPHMEDHARHDPRGLSVIASTSRPPGVKPGFEEWAPLPGLSRSRQARGGGAIQTARAATPWFVGIGAAFAVAAFLLGRWVRQADQNEEADGPLPPGRRVLRAGRVWVWAAAGLGAACLIGGPPGASWSSGRGFHAEVRADPAVPRLPRTLWVAAERDDPAAITREVAGIRFGPGRPGAVLFGSRPLGVQVDRCEVHPPLNEKPRDHTFVGRRRWAAGVNLSWVVLGCVAATGVSLWRSRGR